MILLAFAAACALALPVPVWLLIFPCLMIGYLLWQYPFKPVMFLCVMGVFVTLCHQWLSDPIGLPNKHTIYRAKIFGEIIYLPRYRQNKLSIDVKVQRLNNQNVSFVARLTCYHKCPKITIGDVISLKANLKKPRGFKNSGSFLFEQWAWSHHIDRIGSFNPKSLSILGQKKGYGLGKLRSYLYQGIQHLVIGADAKALMAALTIGITDDIRPGLWKQFRQTGTAHLMAISGAHVGLITGVCFYLFNRLWRFIPRVSLIIPSQRFAALAAIICALFYALIAGFAVPAQRSVIMSGVILFRYLGYRYLNSWQAWQIALFLCVLIEPHSLVMPGFYLSFMAVAVILVISQLFRLNGLLKLLVMQIGCLIGLMPLTLYLFNYHANNGMLANLIAIPYVSMAILPFALLKVILIPVGYGFLGDWLFDKLVHGLTLILSFCMQFEHYNWQFALQSIWQVIEIMVGLCLLLILPKKSIIIPAMILIVIALIPTTIRPKHNHAQIRVFDVGQGLSVLVSTKKHHLLYDTGVKFYGGGGDIGDSVILPFLRYFSISWLDAIVISHTDLDHRGGLASISRIYPKAKLISDSPKFYHKGKNCHGYPTWSWDGVRFEFLSLKPFYKEKNNHSCILKISSQSQSILLPGDIEKEAEHYLLKHAKEKLSSDILILPHHGSKTSSSSSFLQAVSPSIAVISSGLDNRYHFPHPIVLQRLKKQSITVKNTAINGMVELSI